MPIPESNGNSKYKTSMSCKLCQRQPSMGALMTPCAVGWKRAGRNKKKTGRVKVCPEAWAQGTKTSTQLDKTKKYKYTSAQPSHQCKKHAEHSSPTTMHRGRTTRATQLTVPKLKSHKATYSSFGTTGQVRGLGFKVRVCGS